MKTYNYSDLSKKDIQKLVQRNVDPGDGIRAAVEDIIASVRANGDSALLDYAADISADLLVVGGYGHSRTREMVMGGATRDLLRNMTLPVLMSH